LQRAAASSKLRWIRLGWALFPLRLEHKRGGPFFQSTFETEHLEKNLEKKKGRAQALL